MLQSTSLQTLIDQLPQAADPITQNLAVHHIPVDETQHRRQALKFLKENPLPRQGDKPTIHVGVAGFYNFDIAAITRPDGLLLLDANPNQARFWAEIVSLLATCSTSEEFKQQYFARVDGKEFICTDGSRIPSKPHVDSSHLYFENATWLNDPDTYDYFRRLALGNAIAAHTINIVEDRANCIALGKLLKGSNFEVASAYWSNIASYDHPHRNGRYISPHDDVFGQLDKGSLAKGLIHPGRKFNVYGEVAPVRHRDGIDEGVAFRDLPMFERVLRNTAEIGDDHTAHILMHLRYEKKHCKRLPLIISDGPLARTLEQSSDRLFRDYIGETAEQHTQRLRQQREQDRTR